MSTPNLSLLGYDPSGGLPHLPQEGADVNETVSNLLEYNRRLSAALSDLLEQFNTRANLGFRSMTMGANTIYSNENGDLVLAESGTTSIVVDPTTGTMTFSSTGGATTYVKTGDQINVPLAGVEGDTVYCTLNSTAGAAKYAGRVYRHDGSSPTTDASWVEVAVGVNSTTVDSSGVVIWSTGVTGSGKTADNATVGADWTSGNLTNIPTRFGNALPGSGTGLIATATELGYYGSGKSISCSGTGTPRIGEKVTQTNSGATGIIVGLPVNVIQVDVLSGTFTGNVADTLVTEDTGLTWTPYGAAPTTIIIAKVRIDNAGRFYFAGDGSNYLSWDGVKLHIVVSDDIVIKESNSSDTYAIGMNIHNYSTTDFSAAHITLNKSASNTMGTMTATAAGDILGYLVFNGVNSGSTYGVGAYITVTQSGAAGATYVPAEMTLTATDGTAGAPTQLTLIPTTYTVHLSKYGDAEAFRVTADWSGQAGSNTFTGEVDTPTSDPGWASSSTVNMTAPGAYIKIYIGTQAYVIPAWVT